MRKRRFSKGEALAVLLELAGDHVVLDRRGQCGFSTAILDK
jgi:hypothetical protein